MEEATKVLYRIINYDRNSDTRKIKQSHGYVESIIISAARILQYLSLARCLPNALIRIVANLISLIGRG
jgi:hypothetical protein